MAVRALTQMTAAQLVCSQFRSVTNPIAGPAYLTNLFGSLDGTGVAGTIAYMRTMPVGEIVADIRNRLRAPDVGSDHSDRSQHPLPASGKGLTLATSLGSSHGEFVERYASTWAYVRARQSGEIVLASAREMRERGPILGPDRQCFFAPEQYAWPDFPFVPFEEDTRVGWVLGQTLDGGPIWMPAVMVFMGYVEEPGEARIAYPTTGGLCFSSTLRRGIWTGVLELVERDAINLCWISKATPRRILWEMSRARYTPTRENSETIVFSPWTDVPGVDVVHVQYFDFSSPLFLGGGGIDTTLDAALVRAALEIKQCAHATEYLRGSPFDVERRDVKDFFDVVPYYSQQHRIRALFSKMQDALERCTTVELARENSGIVAPGHESRAERLEEVGSVVGPVCVYYRSLESLELPGYVVRCIAPGITLAGVPSTQFLGHPRYYVNRGLNVSTTTLKFDELDLDVLPFP